MEIDSLGGVLNAYTTRETTSYYAKVRKEHIDVASGLLCDIFLNSTFKAEEVARERQVILQELRAGEDTPDDYIHDLFSETFWAGSPLAHPVIGTIESVSSVTRDSLLGYMNNNYSADRIVVAAAGNVGHNRLLKNFQKSFSLINKGRVKRKGDVIHKEGSRLKSVRRKLEQAHFCLGTRGIPARSPKRHTLYVLNTILGAGMSSRLFQEIREKRGLAYSIYSFLSSYETAGLTGVYAGTASESVPEVCRMIIREFKRLKKDPLSPTDLQMAKEQLKGNIVLGLECSESRVERLAGNEMYFGRDVSIEEVMDRIDSVSAEDILELSNELFQGESLNLTVLGDVKKAALKDKFPEMKESLDS